MFIRNEHKFSKTFLKALNQLRYTEPRTTRYITERVKRTKKNKIKSKPNTHPEGEREKERKKELNGIFAKRNIRSIIKTYAFLTHA